MANDEVLIAGGGIGGLSAALCLAAKGFKVRVFEQAPAFGEIGAGIQLSPNCTRVLHRLGLAEALEDVAFFPTGGQIRDWSSGETIYENELGEGLRRRYGFPYYHIHRADLIGALAAAAAAEPRIALHTDTAVDGIEQSADEALLTAGGVRYRGRALLGADGIQSTVRAFLFGPEAPTFTGTVAWRSLVPTSRLPEGFIRPVSSNWWGPGSHFVHYYVRRGELVNCVCVVEKQGWEHESWTERGDREELRRDFAGWHDGIQRLIEAMNPDACYKWALFDRSPMPQWGKGRVTLLGDACHATLPFMAQGAAMAIEDGAVLAECLAADEDVAASLKRYEYLRRARAARIQTGSRRNAELFHLRGRAAAERNRTVGSSRDRTLDWLYRYDAFDLESAETAAAAETPDLC